MKFCVNLEVIALIMVGTVKIVKLLLTSQYDLQLMMDI